MATSSLFKQSTKIVGVSTNYAAYVKDKPVPKEPVIFLKPTSSYLENGGTIEVPHPLDALFHEVELAVVIGQKARDVPESVAMDYVGGYAVALDMSAREIQVAAKIRYTELELNRGDIKCFSYTCTSCKGLVGLFGSSEVSLSYLYQEVVEEGDPIKLQALCVAIHSPHESILYTIDDHDLKPTCLPYVKPE